MRNEKFRKAMAGMLASSMLITGVPVTQDDHIYAKPAETSGKVPVMEDTAGGQEDEEGVYKVTMDESGYITADGEYAADEDTPFSWDNVNMYFVMTDRFFNGDKSNDHAYGRSVGEVGADQYESRIGTFHGGDLAGLTKKLEEASGVETGLDGLPDFKTENTSDPGIPPLLKNKWTKENNYDEKIAMTQASLQKSGTSASVSGYLVAWLSEWVREYGADWTDDFWMTGEHWGHGMEKDSYFTSGAFDSMINFNYQGCEKASGESLDGTFSKYASAINGDPSFNVLSYISSHDSGLGERSARAGIALLLTPGGVQTYYGDESGRQAGQGSGDQPTRSQMNWESTDQSILSVWQKVGRFRRNHISVGAGQHSKIGSEPYTFSRTYSGTVQGEDYEDKVVVALPGKSGTFDISVGDVFEDGTALTDEYSGEVYTVSGGKVSVTCDDTGVILLGEGGVAKASVGATASQSFTTDTLTIKLSASKTSEAYYSLNGGEKVSFTSGDTIVIGEGDDTDTTYKLVLSGIGEEGEALADKTFTYTKVDQPEYTFYLRTKASDYESAPYIYLYGAGGETKEYAGKWPGTKMQKEGDYYVFYSMDFSKANVILTDNNGWQNPVKATKEPVKEPTKEPAKETVSPTKTQAPTKAPTETQEVPKTEKPGETIKPTEKVKDTATPKPTIKPTERVSKPTETTKVPASTKQPETTGVPSAPSNSSDYSSIGEKLSLKSFKFSKEAPQEAGKAITISLVGAGGSGKYAYKIAIENVETRHEELFSGWKDSGTFSWIPSEGGNYKVTAYVSDEGNPANKVYSASQNYRVTNAIVIKSFKATKISRRKVKFKMLASGASTLQYKLMIVNGGGAKTTIKKYDAKKIKVYTFKKSGKYTVYLYIKDATGSVKKVKKIMTVK